MTVNKKVIWNPPANWQQISTIEMHTGGEPLRVIVDGLPEIKGNTILEKIQFFRSNYDYLRTGLMWEPRGHADMYGAVLTEPLSPGSDFGVFFLHNEGYSTMCGHAVIALTRLVLDTGMVNKPGDNPDLVIDAPPGKIYSRGYRENGIVKRVSFHNVPSFVLLKDETIDIPGAGVIHFDVAYGGAFYVITDAEKLGFKLNPDEHNRLIETGRSIKNAVMSGFEIKHPFEEELSFLYGTIFTGRAHDPSNHSRNVCIFADGELDRSATGSGVSARAALHYEMNEMHPGELFTIESILGTTMDVKIHRVKQFGPYTSVIPEVSGSANFTGENVFYFDPEDPLKGGFLFR